METVVIVLSIVWIICWSIVYLPEVFKKDTDADEDY